MDINKDFKAFVGHMARRFCWSPDEHAGSNKGEAGADQEDVIRLHLESGSGE